MVKSGTTVNLSAKILFSIMASQILFTYKAMKELTFKLRQLTLKKMISLNNQHIIANNKKNHNTNMTQ